ncbi:ethionine resistance protein [Mycoemilia scoparia]|uniref:Ethionine resistance protein n=1 Tax=Mycoemilia scoparia TaxID=417184 RepID=A0A9W8DT70_9FUNG|nr:ethionine resistance protein [Mycoemilia scoparia]
MASDAHSGHGEHGPQPTNSASQVTLTENTPLISSSALPSQQITTNLQNEDAEFNDPAAFWPKVKDEFKWITASSASMSMTYFLQYSFSFVNVLSLGHLGAKELGAAMLGTTTNNVITFAPAIGYACALDTFCSTAFTASSDKRLVGFHLQRGLFAVVVHFLMAVPLLWNVESILLLARQNPETAQLCGKFMKVYMLSILPWMLFECLKRFLQAQGDMKTSAKLLIFVAPIHAINNYLLVWSPTFGIGFLGSPLASAITHWTMLIGLVVYISFSNAREAWGGFDWRFIKGISEFYKLAIPSIAMVCCDWWAFEVLSLSASYLGSNSLAAQSIIINTVSLLFQIPAGISVAVSTRVGNMLGAGRAKSSRLSARVGIIVISTYSILSFCVFTYIQTWWGAIYTSDPKLIALVAGALPIVAISQSFDAINITNLGIMRALGRQRLGAIISIPPYYTIMFPVGIYLAYKQPFALGVAGLWLGMAIGLSIIVICQLSFILGYVDWDNEVLICLKRLKDSGPQYGGGVKLNVESLEAADEADPIVVV